MHSTNLVADYKRCAPNGCALRPAAADNGPVAASARLDEHIPDIRTREFHSSNADVLLIVNRSQGLYLLPENRPEATETERYSTGPARTADSDAAAVTVTAITVTAGRACL